MSVLNSDGYPAKLSHDTSSHNRTNRKYKYYCGRRVGRENYQTKCNTCDGRCGPSNGCQCNSCNELDEEKERRSQFVKLVNTDKAPVHVSYDKYHTQLFRFYCGRNVGRSAYYQNCGGCDGGCGPSNGCQCMSCHDLEVLCDSLSNTSSLIDSCLQSGFGAWNRNKIMIVGEGRAGKTALSNAIIGQPFKETESTIGINQLTLDVKYAALTKDKDKDAKGGGGEGDEGSSSSSWGLYEKPAKELEVVIARMVADQIKKAKAEAKRDGKEVEDIAVAADGNNNGDDLLYGLVGGEEEDEGEEGEGDPAAVATMTAGSNSSSKKKKATAAAAAKTSMKKADCDQDLVARLLAEDIQINSQLVISLYDYGGQSVFNVIHHFFLTRYGVYALVFNMEDLLSEDREDRDRALSFLRFWLNSITMHTVQLLLPTTSSSPIGQGGQGQGGQQEMVIAPIALIGTRKDKVNDFKAHQKIHLLLHGVFGSCPAWPYLLLNPEGRTAHGRSTLCFYPVGREDETLQQLLTSIEQSMQSAAYVQQTKPLTWLKLLDELLAVQTAGAGAGAGGGGSRSYLSLTEVLALAERTCHLTSRLEVQRILRFLHEMGVLMYHLDEALRDLVILDPIAFFVQPVSRIICKHVPSQEDPTHHVLSIHRIAQQRFRRDWRQLTEAGLLSRDLLFFLLSDRGDQIETLLLLMIKFGLAVAIRSDPNPTGGATGVGEQRQRLLQQGDVDEYRRSLLPPSVPSTGIQEQEQQLQQLLLQQRYLIPALLPPLPSSTSSSTSSPSLEADHRPPFSSYCTAFFFLSTDSDYTLRLPLLLVGQDLAMNGFLPRGLFKRLVGKALSWSMATSFQTVCSGSSSSSSSSASSLLLYQDLVLLCFGSQRFRLVSRAAYNLLQIDIEGDFPAIILERLTEQLHLVLKECMPSLHYATLLGLDCSSSSSSSSSTPFVWRDEAVQSHHQVFLSLAGIRAKGAGNGLSIPGTGLGPAFATYKLSDLRTLFAAWLSDDELSEANGTADRQQAAFDVFFSYRWGRQDSSFVSALYDLLCGHVTLGDRHRGLRAFLDRKKLRKGLSFPEQLARALIKATVLVPIFSFDALQDLRDHNALQEDNLLVEWILALELLQLRHRHREAIRLQQIFPLFFGPVSSQTGSVDDLFKTGVLETLPETVPTASLAQAAKLLALLGYPAHELSSGFATRSVREIVFEMKAFLGCAVWEAASCQLPDLVFFAGLQVMQLLLRFGPSIDEGMKAMMEKEERQQLQLREASLASGGESGSGDCSSPPPITAKAGASASPAAASRGRPLNDIVKDIAREIGFEDKATPAKVVDFAIVSWLSADLVEDCKALKTIKEKVLFLAEQVGVDVV